jgi:hypothetical protein
MPDAVTSPMCPLVMICLSGSARLAFRPQRLIRVSPLPLERGRRPSPTRSTPAPGLSDTGLRGGSEQALHERTVAKRRGV